jgi:hypothetical protein
MNNWMKKEINENLHLPLLFTIYSFSFERQCGHLFRHKYGATEKMAKGR